MRGEPPRAAGRRPLPPRSRRRLTWLRRALYRIAAPIGLGIVYLCWWTLPRVRVLGRERLEAALAHHRAVILAFWHGQQLVPIKELVWNRPAELRLGLLISPSVDGELPSLMSRRLGITVIRGSSSRTGAQALRALYRAIVQDNVSPVVTPDGSHGPRRVFKPGALLLSQLSGRPVVPMAYAARRAWLFRTWDRFALPWPFTRIVLVIGAPQLVPKGLDGPGLEARRLAMEQELGRLYAQAQAALRE